MLIAGYGPDDSTWEPVTNLEKAYPAIIDFHRRLKKSPAKKTKKTRKSAAVELYEIESIVAHKLQKGQLLYRIHWDGYGSDEDTWEPESHLVEHCDALLALYRKANGLA